MNRHDPPLEVDPRQAFALASAGRPLLDVRSAAERMGGMARGALAVDDPSDWAARTLPADGMLLLCALGQRSFRIASALRERGIAAQSVAGGMAAWVGLGLPLADEVQVGGGLARYARQICLPEVGAAGQARLARARVVLVGVGGLGAPAALYLAAAGVGRITLIDDDVVDRSNLQRQVLYSDSEVGLRKVDVATRRLRALNPGIDVIAIPQKLDAHNAPGLLAGHDVLVDGADNFPARFAVSDASRRLAIPMVYGAVERFSGQVAVFDPRHVDSPCYRCLFPEPPAPGEVPSCAEAGVLGVVPGMIGMLQACETLKLLLGIGAPLVGRLLLVDALAMHWRELVLARDVECPGCGSSGADRLRRTSPLDPGSG